jgi:hypothetical protein
MLEVGWTHLRTEVGLDAARSPCPIFFCHPRTSTLLFEPFVRADIQFFAAVPVLLMQLRQGMNESEQTGRETKSSARVTHQVRDDSS